MSYNARRTNNGGFHNGTHYRTGGDVLNEELASNVRCRSCNGARTREGHEGW
jgi:hypothetical protein